MMSSFFYFEIVISYLMCYTYFKFFAKISQLMRNYEMKNFYLAAILYIFLVLITASCSLPTDNDNDDNDNKLSSTKDITEFYFDDQLNNDLSADTLGIISGTTIKVKVPYNTVVTNLTASFTTTGKSVSIDSNIQTSGETANDFTEVVTYLVTAADGSTKEFIVEICFVPSGYSISFIDDYLNNTTKTSAEIRFNNAIIGTTYNYSISSNAGGTPKTGNGAITEKDQTITNIDCSALNDGTLTVSVTLTDDDNNTGIAASDTIIKDIVTPTATPSKADLSTINDTADLIIDYDESIKTTTLVVNGTIGDTTSDWSNITFNNDRLTISPESNWTEGDGKTLSVTCSDLAGNSKVLNLSYNVFSGSVVYVRKTGNDSNSGSSVSPKLTIQSAVDFASTLSNGEVRVAAGVYDENVYVSGEVLIKGGYKADDWATRNVSVHTTTINSTSSTGGSAQNPTYAVCFYGTGSGSGLDGFAINGKGGSYSSGVFINQSSGIISNNIIDGGTGSDRAYGIYIGNYSFPEVDGNTITGNTTADESYMSYGVYVSVSRPASFQNNTINGGNGTGKSYGVYNYGSPAYYTIDGCNINGGHGNESYGIYNQDINNQPIVIQNCDVNGGDSVNGSNDHVSYGIFNYASYATITGNSIDGGTADYKTVGIKVTQSNGPDVSQNRIFGGTGNYTCGIDYESYSGVLTGTVRNNLIHAGTHVDGSWYYSYGINLYSKGNCTIQNNTIYIGGGPANPTNYCSNKGINIFVDSLPTIDNNIIFGSGSGMFTTTIGIAETQISANPADVRNNNIYITGTAGTKCMYQYHDGTTTYNLNTISSGKFSDGSGHEIGADNVSADPSLNDVDGADNLIDTMNDNDWSLSGATPVSIYQGGYDHSAVITKDFENADRTAPMSIGAYEKN